MRSLHPSFSRVRIDGLHLATSSDLLARCDVVMLTATDIEKATVSQTLEQPENVEVASYVLKEVVVGFRGDTIIGIGLAKEKRAFCAYGATIELLTMAPKAKAIFKVGGATARLQVGTIAILARGDDGIVLHGKTISFNLSIK